MAQLDKIIEVLYRYAGDRVTLRPDAKITMHLGGSTRDVSRMALRAEQIPPLLREIATAEVAAALDTQQDAAFVHPAPAGPVQVNLRWIEGRPYAELTPDTDGAPTAATPVQVAPSTPSPAAAGAHATAAGRPTPTAPGAAGSTGAPRAQMDRWLLAMIEHDCSDLHLTSGQPPLYRKDGELQPLVGPEPVAADAMHEVLASITPPDKHDEFTRTLDSDFSYEIPGKARYRCNLFVDRTGPGGVFRRIPFEIPRAEDLGLPSSVIDLCSLHKGLVIVTGPTGSGKSTTLAAMIDWINRNRATHIITIEDPIEFVYRNDKALINQREVSTHTASFKNALRAALREDPDIVLVGEMRDLETVAIALETAETGHLVFGTLHTNTAPGAVDRIIDQFPSDQQNQVRTMLASVLRGVIAQTLCRRKQGGRVAAQEILLTNGAVSNLIREGKTFQIQSVMQTGKGSGMQTLNDALLALVKSGTVDPEEAYARAVARSEFASLAQRAGVRIDGA